MTDLVICRIRLWRKDRLAMHAWLDYNCPSWDYAIDKNGTRISDKVGRGTPEHLAFIAVLIATENTARAHPKCDDLFSGGHLSMTRHDATIMLLHHDIENVEPGKMTGNARLNRKLEAMVFS